MVHAEKRTKMKSAFDLKSEISLPADCVRAYAQKRIDELNAAIIALEDCLAQSPEGTLYYSISHGRSQWQCYVNGVKRFLPMSDLASIRGLAQKKYVELVLESLRKQSATLECLLQEYHPDACNEIYASMRPEFQNVVESLFPSGEELAAAWKSVRYRGKSLEGANLMSLDGVKVRSKSELMIANALAASGVPYRYEFPHKMNWRCNDGRVRLVKVHPDFTCLNLRTRREFIWEHFGMMDDSKYADETLEKFEDYERNGFVFGENFVYTMESKAHPLDLKKIQAVINRWLI